MNQKDYRKFKPNDAIIEHVKSKTYIAETIKNDPTGTYVVVSHHAPSKASIKPKYERDHLMNGAYSSDLSDFILDHPQIKLWTHGHTHEPFDYMIGSTRVVCNPRGYHGYESRADKFELQYLDIQVNNSGI
jgi:Icc-related predicted phosphoesterase